MQKKGVHIIYSWLLLVCFITGQYMVAVHQHKLLKQTNSIYSINKHHQKNASAVQEKCYLCDAMHHFSAVLNNTIYYSAITALPHIYKVGDHAFISMSLLLASGRAPPVSSVYC